MENISVLTSRDNIPVLKIFNLDPKTLTISVHEVPEVRNDLETTRNNNDEVMVV